MFNKLIFLVSLSGLLAGCAFSSIDPTPTPFPPEYIQSLVAQTGQAANQTEQALTPAVLPTKIITPTITFTPLPPAATPTFTPEPNIPYAQIQFLEPGPMSKVVSPVNLQMMVVAGESEIIQIDLLGENGRLLARTIERMNRNEGGLFENLKIPFEVRAAAEKAWLQVSTKDQYGRMQTVNTIQFVLLSSGTDEITPAGNLIYERCVLFNLPVKDASASGGLVVVEGRMWPFNKQPIILDLILPDGKVTGSRIVNMDGLDSQNFATTIPYKVKEPVLARLSIRQDDLALNAPIYIYSQEVLLNP